MKIVGGKLMDVCPDCAKIVRLDKPIFGSAHICSSPEERKQYADVIRAAYEITKRKLEGA